MRYLLIGLLMAVASIGWTANQYPVTFGGQFLFYVWGGHDAGTRVTTIEGRLVHVLTDTTLTRADVHVVELGHGGVAVVYVGNVAFATATEGDARISGMTPKQTANHWADQIRLVLTRIKMIPHSSHGAS